MDELLKKQIYEFHIEEVKTLPTFFIPGITNSKGLASADTGYVTFRERFFEGITASVLLGEATFGKVIIGNDELGTKTDSTRKQTLDNSATLTNSSDFIKALKEAIDHKEKTLYDYIIMYCKLKHFEKESDLYKKACVNAKTFAKIRNSETPSKLTLLRICLGLELNLKQTQEMLNVAGYSLSNNNIFDKIIAFCLDKGVVNIDRVEDYIYEMTGQTYLIPSEI